MGNTSESMKKERNEDIDTFLENSGQSFSEYKKEDYTQPFAHQERVNCLYFDPKSQILWTGSNDKNVCGWNVNGKLSSLFSGHSGIVSCLTMDENSGILYSGSFDRTVISWNIKTGQQIQVFKKNKNWVTCIAVYSDDSSFISSSKRKRSQKDAFKNDSFATITPSLLFVGGYDSVINVYHIKKNKKIMVLKGHSMQIEDLKIKKDGLHTSLFSSSLDGTIREWSVSSGSGKCVRVFRNYKEKFINIFRFGKPKNIRKCFNISIFRNSLYCKVEGEGINCWKLQTNSNLLPTKKAKTNFQISNPSKHPSSLFDGISAFDINGKFLLGWNMSTSSFQIWELSTNCLVCSINQDILNTNTVHFVQSKGTGKGGNFFFFYTIGSDIIKVELKKKIFRSKSLSKLTRSKSLSKVSSLGDSSKKGKSNLEITQENFSDLIYYFVKVQGCNRSVIIDLIKSLEIDKKSPKQLSKASDLDSQIKLISDLLSTKTPPKHPPPKSITNENKKIDVKKEEKKDRGNDSKKQTTEREIREAGKNEGKIEKIEKLGFDEKLEVFYKSLFTTTKNLQPSVLVVRRDQLVIDACKHFRLLKNKDFQKPLFIFFADEEGLDSGGVTREFYFLLSQEILNPLNALFCKKSNNSYHINPGSKIANFAHLEYFEFIGKLIGKAVLDLQMINLPFSNVIYKKICGKPVGFDDLELVEPIIYESLKKLTTMTSKELEILGVTFTASIDDFGRNNTIELIENGKDKLVTKENVQQFVKVYAEWYMITSVKEQLDKILTGVYSVIEKERFQIFDEKELELLVCGSRELNVRDWKLNTVYEGYNENSPAIKLFWDAIQEMSRVERLKLLQFITGTSCVPVEGFRELNPSFSVTKLFHGSSNHYPIVHTCLNRIEIPLYDNVKHCKAMLLKAIKLSKGFDNV